jgi:hypothetical protein
LAYSRWGIILKIANIDAYSNPIDEDSFYQFSGIKIPMLIIAKIFIIN